MPGEVRDTVVPRASGFQKPVSLDGLVRKSRFLESVML